MLPIMTIYNLVDLPPKDLDIIIQNTASKTDMSSAIVEKDLWVSAILDYLFTLSPWKDSLAFKGGTSLSKAYSLIERFSEDIDLILDWRVIGYATKEPLMDRSATRQDKYNKQMLAGTEDFLKGVFIPHIKGDLGTLIGRNLKIYFEDDAVVIDYGNKYSDKSILHTIRLEIGALAAWTPTQIAIIRPYIAEVYPDKFGDTFVKVRTTTPERTFWEKITILHREAFRPENSPLPLRMSRHYYDIYRMAKLGILDRALQNPDLLDQVAAFKAKFYPQKWAHYVLAKLGTLSLVPARHNLRPLQRDYAAMAGMIYGEMPEFEELMAEVIRIEVLVN